MGTLLAEEFLVAVGDLREGFNSADQLAAFAGLAPAQPATPENAPTTTVGSA
jgi:transposase